MTPVLYILMRNDMDSLNPGKAIAQGSHATNDFEYNITSETDNITDAVKAWKDEGFESFGTCIVLGATENQIGMIVDSVETIYGLAASDIIDPTYPITDGDTLHFLPVMTCAWLFAEDAKLAQPYLSHLDLYK